MGELKQQLIKNTPIKITKQTIRNLENMVNSFEIRDEHPLLLNSPLLGCYNLRFSYNDRAEIFNIFQCEEDLIKYIIKNIKSIPNEFKVVSDPFNIFVTWVIHLMLSHKTLSKKDREHGAFLLSNCFQYKLFGSINKNFFKYGADIDTMSAVIEDLNQKYNIKVESTWKRTIYKRTNDLILDKKSIHHNTIMKYEPDKQILYMISDIQTRIRNQVKVIASLYYDYKETDNKIKSISLVNEIDGKKLLREKNAVHNLMMYTLTNHIKFGNLNHKYIVLMTYLYKSLNKSLITRALTIIHNVYLDQTKQKITKKVIVPRNKRSDNVTEIYVGIDKLIKELLSFSFTVLLKSNNDFNKRLSIINTLYKTYSSSRLSDQQFLNIKHSTKQLIINNNIVKRKATIGSLVPCVLLYYMSIGLESFK